MSKLALPRKTRARMHNWSQRGRECVTLLLLAAVLISLTAAAANLAGVPNAAEAQPVVGATTHPIQYWIGCAPSMVTTTNLNYFKQQGFTAVVMVVPTVKRIKRSSPRSSRTICCQLLISKCPFGRRTAPEHSDQPFCRLFQSLKTAGWQYVASEGGRPGDLAYLQNYFKGYVNFNCDQCGLWQNPGIRCIQTHSRSRTAGRATTPLSGRQSRLEQSRPLRLASRTASSPARG